MVRVLSHLSDRWLCGVELKVFTVASPISPARQLPAAYNPCRGLLRDARRAARRRGRECPGFEGAGGALRRNLCLSFSLCFLILTSPDPGPKIASETMEPARFLRPDYLNQVNEGHSPSSVIEFNQPERSITRHASGWRRRGDDSPYRRDSFGGPHLPEIR